MKKFALQSDWDKYFSLISLKLQLTVIAPVPGRQCFVECFNTLFDLLLLSNQSVDFVP